MTLTVGRPFGPGGSAVGTPGPRGPACCSGSSVRPESWILRPLLAQPELLSRPLWALETYRELLLEKKKKKRKNIFKSPFLFSNVSRFSGRTSELQLLSADVLCRDCGFMGDDCGLTCLFKALQVFPPVPDLAHQGLAVWGRTLKLLQPFLQGLGGLQQRSRICGRKRRRKENKSLQKELLRLT